MIKESQVYIDKIPEIVSDALPKLEELGYNIWNIDEDCLDMSDVCSCIFGQLEWDYGTSTRFNIKDKCPIGYFETPIYYLDITTYARYGISNIEVAQFSILYYEILTAEYKKQIKQWKKNKKLHKPKEIINNINIDIKKKDLKELIPIRGI